MSVHKIEDQRKVTTHRLREMKERGEKISMLTAYDYSMATILDSAGVDVLLIGDSASNVICGNTTTLPITLDEMIFLAKGVMKAAKRALVVCDMPFGTYQGNSLEALNSAIRIMKETGVDCIKMEGGEEVIDSIKRIISAGIPVISDAPVIIKYNIIPTNNVTYKHAKYTPNDLYNGVENFLITISTN